MWNKTTAGVALALALTACGGGSGNPGGSTVTNLTASPIAYGRTMTVTVSGSKLDEPGLQMTVDGPCGTVTKSAAVSDSQASFSCPITGAGPISPRIRNADGLELARLNTTVPLPQVTIAINQASSGAAGSVVVELDPDAAPITVKNFMFYVTTNFYNNTLIHRALANQLIQGGGYTTGPALKPPTAAAITLESNNGLKNLRGTIAMARTSEPNSATSQYYFNLADNPAFDFSSDALPGYAVFGRVLSGLEVLDRIGAVAVEDGGEGLPSLPVREVVVTSIVQSR